MSQDFRSDPASRSIPEASWDRARPDPTSGVGDEASRQGAAAMDSLKEGTRSLGDQAKQRASRYVEGGKEAVTEHLDAFAQAIKRAGDELSEKDQTMAAQVVRQAAGGLESLSRSIGGASVQDMVRSVRSFGRANPTAFIGGAVLAGLALGRFARASSRHGETDWRRADDDWENGNPVRRDDGRSYANDPYRDDGTGDAPFGSGPSYRERSPFASGAESATGQGYAGGGMGTGTSRPGGPSTETDTSDASASFSGTSTGSGSISTGERS